MDDVRTADRQAELKAIVDELEALNREARAKDLWLRSKWNSPSHSPWHKGESAVPLDVDGVFAVPGRVVRVVPDTLQICRLPPRTARPDHQVSAKLKQESDKLRIASSCKGLNASVGRLFACRRSA